MLSEPELSTAESPLADKKAPGSERAAERAAAAQQNNERARLAPRPSYVNMQVMIKKKKMDKSSKCRLPRLGNGEFSELLAVDQKLNLNIYAVVRNWFCYKH